MHERAVEQVGHGGQADVRVRRDVGATTGRQLLGADEVGEDERPDHPPGVERQQPIDRRRRRRCCARPRGDDPLDAHVAALATNHSSAAGSASESRAAATSGGVPVRMRFTGTSSFLPDSVRGTDGTASISSGTWRGDSSVRSAARIRAGQVVVELATGRERDEQDEPAEPAALVVLEVHDQAVGDLGEALDDGVEVARTEAHAAPVERGVGAPADHAGAVVGERDPVAVAPDAGEVLEVGGAVAAAVVVVPEARRASTASGR